MPVGFVKWFNDKKGYGFISSEDVQGDIFVHYSAIDQEGFKTLIQGQKVQFELGANPKGARAASVVVLPGP